MVEIPEVSDFAEKIIDGIKKRICPKCGEAKDGRGIKSHWLSCEGELDQEDDDMVKAKGKGKPDPEPKDPTDPEDLESSILEKTDKKFEEITKAFDDKFSSLSDDIMKAVKGKGKAKDDDEEPDEEEDEDEDIDLEKDEKAIEDMDFTKVDYAIIAMVIGILFVMVMIVMHYVNEEKKDGKRTESKDSKKESAEK